MSHNTPFFHGNPVPPNKLIGRNNELYTIAGRISTGQSTAVTGSPRSGKTSILKYLEMETLLYDHENSEKPITLYDEDIKEKLIFSYLDAYTWGTEFKPIDFWKSAFQPLQDYINNNKDISKDISKAYQYCQKNHFDTYSIEKLIKEIGKTNKQLVLFIDGLEVLLNYSAEHWNAQFFGSLRTIASLSGGTLVLVVATNQSLSHLQKAVQAFTKTNSPYFNFIYEVRLGALSKTSIDELLNPGEFEAEDINFIKDIAGGHPYLLQVLASIVWDYKKENDLIKRHQKALNDFYLQVHDDLDEIWQSWVPALQQAFTSVVLVQLSSLKEVFKKQRINIDNLSRNIPPERLDLAVLKYYGFVTEDENITSGWRVVPFIFIPFILLGFKPKYKENLPKTAWDIYTKIHDEQHKKSLFFKWWTINK